MPLYMLKRLDKPNALDLRMTHRPAHLDFARSLNDSLIYAGPILDPDNGNPVGSLILLEAADAQAVQALADADPYARAGLFAETEIRLTRKVLPE